MLFRSERVGTLAGSGVDFGVFLSGLADMLRAQLAVVLNGKADGVTPSALAALTAHRDQFSPGDLLRMLSILGNIEIQFRRSSQQQLLVEMLLGRFALLDRAISLEEVISGLGGGGNAAPVLERGNASTDRPAARTRPAQTLARPSVDILPSRKEPSAAVQEPVARNPSAGGPDWKAGFDQTARNPGNSRLTTEAVREERLSRLRADDPVLDAAVRELDLDLLD